MTTLWTDHFDDNGVLSSRPYIIMQDEYLTSMFSSLEDKWHLTVLSTFEDSWANDLINSISTYLNIFDKTPSIECYDRLKFMYETTMANNSKIRDRSDLESLASKFTR